ncbi:MAG: glycosyl hydrolase 115 family protein [Clostridia bacterium]|nr:glycosyl hydrolase 115 family protein [Clostridia bacterium]
MFEFSQRTRIIAEESLSPIHHAADILRRDMEEILPQEGPENSIQVTLDPTLPAESYTAEVSETEIRLTCADALGAVYALLSVSERLLGVKPFGWWSGLPNHRVAACQVPDQTWASPAYRVRWRGWFINDEVLLDGWCFTPAQRHRVWQRSFEALLRLGGNLVIAGTDRQYDGEIINLLASEMGLRLAQHHAEMLGAPMFARTWPHLEPSYSKYPEKFEALWRRGIQMNEGRPVLWTVGFRGQGDHAFWDDDPKMDTDAKRGAFISAMIRKQMAMVREKEPEAVFCSYLYGEMMSLYRDGHLDIPEEVIRIWSDNGFGKMVSRRQGLDNPRIDAMPGPEKTGASGIYYHAGFYDLQAANHLTMLQVPFPLVIRELKTVLERGGDQCWIINSGSIRPHLFTLELIRRLWRDGDCDLEKAAAEYAVDYFEDASLGCLLTAYGESSAAYGPHEDDRAGDQFYHFPVREMANALARGEKWVQKISWAAPAEDFDAQAAQMADIAAPGVASWGRYEQQCRAALAKLRGPAAHALEDLLLTPAILHRAGCETVLAFAQACRQALRGNDLQAFLWTDRALAAVRETREAMARSEHGMFAHFYRNDCFTNVGLTEQVLTGMRAFFRLRGDGTNQFDWERKYLIPPAETRVTLQSHITRQLEDEALANGLRDVIELERI